MSALTTRLATAADAHEAVAVVRRSISELCAADHQHDAPTLERWLRNKTPEHFSAWCENLDNRLVIAERDSALAGVALLHRSGEIRLFYVAPEGIRAGVGRALLRALEGHARSWGIVTLRLDSSLTARHFYERCGFVTAGDKAVRFGVLCVYPYLKTLSVEASHA